MRNNHFMSVAEAIKDTALMLKTYGEVVRTESWQGIKQEREMFELLEHSFTCPMPLSIKAMQDEIKPDLPWAEDHFIERVSGKPLNPGEQYKNWPHYKDRDFNDSNFRKEYDGKFTHTYMERYWPKLAGGMNKPIPGIRYDYGDLNDVVGLILREPYTRQAYLPVWFPEDTGVNHGGRVPCTIGYHFIMRNNKLHIHYTIRACDYLRHFRNDIYLTIRLAYWLLGELIIKDSNYFWSNVGLGNITMEIISLHVFAQEKNLI